MKPVSFQNHSGDVISDVMVLSEKSPLPSGYAYVTEFLDPSEFACFSSTVFF